MAAKAHSGAQIERRLVDLLGWIQSVGDDAGAHPLEAVAVKLHNARAVAHMFYGDDNAARIQPLTHSVIALHLPVAVGLVIEIGTGEMREHSL